MVILSHVIDFLNYDRCNTNAVIRRNSYVLLVIIMTDIIIFGHAVIFDIELFNLAEKYSINTVLLFVNIKKKETQLTVFIQKET